MLCLVAFLTGCDKGPAREPAAAPLVVDRMKDPVYTNALVTSRKEQVALVKRAEPVRQQMEIFRKKARAALPKDATEEQVLEELDLHPSKYPGWRELKESAEKLEADLKKEQQAVRELIRARIQKETADKKAVK